MTSGEDDTAALGTGMGILNVGQVGHILYVCSLIRKSSLEAVMMLAGWLSTLLRRFSRPRAGSMVAGSKL